MSEKPTICRHGCLRRSCETCDLAEDVERLERERDEALDALRKVLPYMRVDTPNACEAFDTARAILDKVKE